jgi:quinone-modifying oxidoreductase subunit QmoC
MANPASALPAKEAELRAAFWDQVSSFPEGHRIKKCIQCGTCTGTCPVSYAMDITPRQVVALFRAGHLEEILNSRTIWICASCYSCTVRCPQEIRVTDTMYALKRIAMEKGIYPKQFPVHILSRTFTANVYKYGRNYELGLAIRYFLKTDIVKLITNAWYGLTLIRRGRLGIFPKRIARVRQVQAIIRKANEFGEN